MPSRCCLQGSESRELRGTQVSWRGAGRLPPPASCRLLSTGAGSGVGYSSGPQGSRRQDGILCAGGCEREGCGPGSLGACLGSEGRLGMKSLRRPCDLQKGSAASVGVFKTQSPVAGAPHPLGTGLPGEPCRTP